MLSVTLFVHICPRLWQPIPRTKPCISSKNPVTANTSTSTLTACPTGFLVASPWRPEAQGSYLSCWPQNSSGQPATSPVRVIFLTYADFFSKLSYCSRHEAWCRVSCQNPVPLRLQSPSSARVVTLVFDLLLPPAVSLQPCRLPHLRPSTSGISFFNQDSLVKNTNTLKVPWNQPFNKSGT